MRLTLTLAIGRPALSRTEPNNSPCGCACRADAATAIAYQTRASRMYTNMTVPGLRTSDRRSTRAGLVHLCFRDRLTRRGHTAVPEETHPLEFRSADLHRRSRRAITC